MKTQPRARSQQPCSAPLRSPLSRKPLGRPGIAVRASGPAGYGL